MNQIEALQSSQLFKDLPEAQLGQLASLSEDRSLTPGWELIREGGDVDALNIMVMGTVRVSQKDANGDDEEIAVLGSGSYFGEMEFVRPGHHATATVTATETCRAVAISHAALREACEADFELGYHVYRSLAAALARRLAKTTSAATHFKSMVVKHR